MTILDSLKSISGYPIPEATFQEIALKRGLTLESAATKEDLLSNEYNLSKADIYSWLSKAPDVTQEGITYKFTDAQREQLKQDASLIYNDLGESSVETIFGYKGTDL